MATTLSRTIGNQTLTFESGTMARVLKAQLEDGRHVTVPRANVELIQYS